MKAGRRRRCKEKHVFEVFNQQIFNFAVSALQKSSTNSRPAVKEETSEALPQVFDEDQSSIVLRNKFGFKFPTSYFEPETEPTLTLDDFLLIAKAPDFIRSRIVRVLDDLKTGLRDTFGAYCAFRLPDRLPRK